MATTIRAGHIEVSGLESIWIIKVGVMGPSTQTSSPAFPIALLGSGRVAGPETEQLRLESVLVWDVDVAGSSPTRLPAVSPCTFFFLIVIWSFGLVFSAWFPGQT